MSWTERLAAATLIAISVAAAVAVAEVGYALLPKSAPPHMFEHRYPLYWGGGPIFRNEGRIFTYAPSRRFRAVAYYDVGGRWLREYDYEVATNNHGLVQHADIVPGKPSILFLGDSFTEGVGAPPWIDGLTATLRNSPFQFVNGGMLGTGPAQWLLLHEYLADQGLRPAKVVVIFISDDFLRDVWNHPEYTLRCIEMPTSCVGNESFYGMPEQGNMLEFLGRLRRYRQQALGPKDLKTRLANKFPATHLAYRTAKDLVGVKPAEVRLNEEAIRTLISRYKSDALFIHLPQVDEIVLGRTHRIGMQGRELIRRNGGEVVDGSRCQLTRNDYFQHDAHPNSRGYEKISSCVQDIILRKWLVLSEK